MDEKVEKKKKHKSKKDKKKKKHKKDKKRKRDHKSDDEEVKSFDQMMKGESDDNIITTAADRSKPEKKRDEKHAQKASKAKVKIDELDEEIL